MQRDRSLQLRNIALFCSLSTTSDADRSRAIDCIPDVLTRPERPERRDYVVKDCDDDMAAFATFDEALAYWRVAPRRYGRNSLVHVINRDRVDLGNWSGLTDEEWERYEDAQEDRINAGQR